MQPYDESLVLRTNEKVKALYAEANQSIDAQYPVWVARTVYDYCAGMPWTASEVKHLNECRQALGITIPLPPGPGPNPPPTGNVRLENGVLIDENGPINGLGTTLFWTLWGYKFDRDRLDQNLRALEPGRFHYVRIFGQVGESETDPAWGDRYIDPDWPDYAEVLRGALDLCASHGFRIKMCIFASINRFKDDAACDRFIDKIVDAIHGREYLIFHWEIANEGYRTGSNREQLRRLARYLKSRVSGPVAITAAQDALEACHLYDNSIVPFATEHFDRDCSKSDGPWRPVRQPWGWPGEYYEAWEKAYPGTRPPVLPPCSNNEPIGPYSSGYSEHDPLRLITAAAVSWIAGCPSYVYHCGPGIYGGGQGATKSGSPANFWEVEGLTETLHGFSLLQALPQGIAGWNRANSGWENYPWNMQTGVGEGMFASGVGCVRAYATMNDQQVVCVPFGIKDHVTLGEKRAMIWRVHSLLNGQLIKEGQGGLTLNQEDGEAQLILGQFV